MPLGTRLFALLSMLFGTMFLAGCVTTAFPVNGAWGDRVNLASKIVCTGEETSTPSIYAVMERRSPDRPSRFKYHIAYESSEDVIEAVFRETDTRALYLVQLKDPGQDWYQYYWYDETTYTFSAFEHDSQTVLEAAKQFSAAAKVEDYRIHVTGSERDVRTFMNKLHTYPREFSMNCLPIAS